MGRKDRRDRRRSALKVLPPATDRAVAGKQLAFCKNLVKKLLADEDAYSFSEPVSKLWSIDELPGYNEKVPNPMDLGTVRTGLGSGAYTHSETRLFHAEAFRADLRLIFLNAKAYNERGTYMSNLAQRFLDQIDDTIKDLPSAEGAAHADDDLSDASAGGDDLVNDTEPGGNEKSLRDDDDDDDGQGNDHDGEKSPMGEEALERQIADLKNRRAASDNIIAEIDIGRNARMTDAEIATLRDEVEVLPWEKGQEVVAILRKYVDAKIAEMGKGADPEFVTLELSDVEPHILRDVEAAVRPDPTREREVAKLAEFDRDISAATSKLKRIQTREIKKKPRRRR